MRQNLFNKPLEQIGSSSPKKSEKSRILKASEVLCLNPKKVDLDTLNEFQLKSPKIIPIPEPTVLPSWTSTPISHNLPPHPQTISPPISLPSVQPEPLPLPPPPAAPPLPSQSPAVEQLITLQPILPPSPISLPPPEAPQKPTQKPSNLKIVSVSSGGNHIDVSKAKNIITHKSPSIIELKDDNDDDDDDVIFIAPKTEVQPKLQPKRIMQKRMNQPATKKLRLNESIYKVFEL